MDAAELKRWLASVARLTPAQKAELLNALSTRDDEAEVGPLNKTPLARLRMKAKWLQQEDVLARGPIIRLASAELGVAASTAFRWRHRFLQLAQPGVKTIWIGLQRIMDFASGMRFMRDSAHAASCV